MVLDVMSPDWDILVEVQQVLQNLPSVRLQFVRGHQDTAMAAHRLLLLAQINEEADALANQYQDKF